MSLNNTVGKLLKKVGYTVYNTERYKLYKHNLWLSDVKSLMNEKDHPVIMDIGANAGQTVAKLIRTFPGCTIHSFEPSPSTFKDLVKNYGNSKNIFLNNTAVGSQPGTMPFLENDHSGLSSFLEPAKIWGKVTHTTMVDVITIDDYCAEKNIQYIDVLKADVQGYEYEVLKGADRMLANTNLVYIEFILTEMYKDIPSFFRECVYLEDRGFKFFNFYEMHYENGMLSDGNAIFIKGSNL